MPNKPWTKEEVNSLIKGENIPTRTEKSIKRKLIRMGLANPKFIVKKNHTKKIWTKEEIKLLKQNKKIHGRTPDSIRRKKIRLGIIDPSKENVLWGKEKEDFLRELVKQGKTPKQIFEMNVFISRSLNSIKKKIQWMNLSKKTPKTFFTKDQINEFKKFLINNWVGKTPKELADLWNNTHKFKIKKSKVLYYLNVLNIKISQREVVSINKIRKEDEKIKTMKFNNPKAMEEKLKFSRVELMKKRLEENKDIWSGLEFDLNFNTND